jgi:type III pantothenate kinase
MKLITIDHGNSNPNWAKFIDGKIQSVELLSTYKPTENETVVITSVKKDNHLKVNFDLNNYKKNNTFFGMPYDYSESIGVDRLVGAYYAFSKSKNSTLLIDAGTFITIDLVSNKGFEGGYIFPGIKTFLGSYKNGELLPNLTYSKLELDLLPKNTNEAILKAAQIYIKSILLEIIKSTSPSQIILTGGSLENLSELFNEFNLKIEIQKAPHLLHHSMHAIYSHHLK